MEWVTKLHGKTVGLDTAPLIFFIEQHELYADVLRPFFTALAAGQFRAVTSTVTLLEVLVHPLRHGDEVLAHRYNDILLSSPNISTYRSRTQRRKKQPSSERDIISKRLMRFSWRSPPVRAQRYLSRTIDDCQTRAASKSCVLAIWSSERVTG